MKENCRQFLRPQTSAYALLAAGRLEDAEAAARQAISDLEKENAALKIATPVLQLENVASTQDHAALDEQNSPAKNNAQLIILADALIAYGIALARLKNLEAAQATGTSDHSGRGGWRARQSGFGRSDYD